MKAAANKKPRRQHADFNQRPDSGVIWLHELVKDPKHADRIPLLPISATTLWRNIDDGRFPRPVYKRVGWRLGDVRAWMRRRNALQLPPPDSAQSTAKLFSRAPPGTRGSKVDSVRRVPQPVATPMTAGCNTTPLVALVHDHCLVDGGDQVAWAQGMSCPPPDATRTNSSSGPMAGEPCDVRLLLRSISEGAPA